MRRFSSRHNSPVVAHPLMQHTLSSQPASPVPHTPGSAAAMSAAAISPLTAAFAAAAGAASGLAAARGGSPGGGGSDGSATPLRRMGSISRAGSFGPDPSPLQSSSNSLRELYTCLPSPSMSMTSAGGGSPMAAEEADAESPRAAHARYLLGQRPPGARQRLGFQTVAVTGGAQQRPPSPGVGHSRAAVASVGLPGLKGSAEEEIDFLTADSPDVSPHPRSLAAHRIIGSLTSPTSIGVASNMPAGGRGGPLPLPIARHLFGSSTGDADAESPFSSASNPLFDEQLAAGRGSALRSPDDGTLCEEADQGGDDALQLRRQNAMLHSRLRLLVEALNRAADVPASQKGGQGVLTDASAGLAAARAMEEAAAADLDRARTTAQEQELAGLREALAFEEALRQQATDELEEAQAQLASTQAAMNDLLHGGLLTNAEPGQGATSRTRPAAAPATDSSDVIGAANGAPALNASMHLRSAELQTDRDEWRRRAERACADLSALREHVTAVCAEGRHAEIGLLNAQQEIADLQAALAAETGARRTAEECSGRAAAEARRLEDELAQLEVDQREEVLTLRQAVSELRVSASASSGAAQKEANRAAAFERVLSAIDYLLASPTSASASGRKPARLFQAGGRGSPSPMLKPAAAKGLLSPFRSRAVNLLQKRFSASHSPQWANKHTYRQQAPADAGAAKAQVMTDIAVAATSYPADRFSVCTAAEPAPLAPTDRTESRTSLERATAKRRLALGPGTPLAGTTSVANHDTVSIPVSSEAGTGSGGASGSALTVASTASSSIAPGVAALPSKLPETASGRQDELSSAKLEQQNEAGPRSPWGHHPATSSSTSSSSASRSAKKALNVRSCGALVLPNDSMSQAADAYTIPAARVRIDGTSRLATGGATSANTKERAIDWPTVKASMRSSMRRLKARCASMIGHSQQ